MKTRSTPFLRCGWSAGRPLFNSLLKTIPASTYPHIIRFLRVRVVDSRELSIKRTLSAPLLRASSPKLPVPAKRSSTFSPDRS